MIVDAFELTDNTIIIGNHDRIEFLPDLPDILLDALQLYSPEEYSLMILFHMKSSTVNDGCVERKVKRLS